SLRPLPGLLGRAAEPTPPFGGFREGPGWTLTASRPLPWRGAVGAGPACAGRELTRPLSTQKMGRATNYGRGRLDDVVARTVSPGFVGREPELKTLIDAAERSRKSSATTVLLGGEGGVGKSRLIGRFAEQVAQEGVNVVSGGCVELSVEGLPYAP